MRRGWTEWVKPTLIALALLALITRIPVIIAFARDEAKGVPAACQTDPRTLRSALRAAPARVTLDGVPLPDCFARSSGGGEVQTVGGTVLSAVSELSREADRAPDGPAALQLGYLLGAARTGTARAQGIWETLMQRIEQEAAAAERTPALRRGERAGRASG